METDWTQKIYKKQSKQQNNKKIKIIVSYQTFIIDE